VAFGLCLLTSLMFGWLPALRFSRPVIISSLKDDAGAGGLRVGRVHRVTAALQVAIAGPLPGLAGPVAGGLSEARERIEHGALAGVGIAGERHDVIVAGHVDAQLLQVAEVVRRTGGARLGRGMTHAEASWTFCT